MSADTIQSDMDYDIESTNEFFVAGWDPYVVELTADAARSSEPAEQATDSESL